MESKLETMKDKLAFVKKNTETIASQKLKSKDSLELNSQHHDVSRSLIDMHTFATNPLKRVNRGFDGVNEAKMNFEGILRHVAQDPSMTVADFFGKFDKFLTKFAKESKRFTQG